MSEWLERQGEKRDLAELRVLGTALARADLCNVVVARLTPEAFKRDAHRLVADAIWSLRAEGREADLEQVTDRLVGTRSMEAVGGAGALWALLQHEEPTLQSIDDLLTIERRRRVWQVCHNGALEVTNPDRAPDDVAAEVFGALRESDRSDQRGPISTDDLLAMERPRWLVDDLLPEGLNVLFGSPKAGKSYLALSMAWSLATGMPWFRRNRDRLPQQVLYLAGEGVGDLRLRAEAMLEHVDRHPGGRLSWWPVTLRLAHDADAARLRLEVERIGADVIFVDTWARYSGVRDENDAAQTQAAVGALEQLCREGRSVVIVHHTAKSGVMRGSSALAGAVEAAIRVEVNDQSGRMRLSSEMARRGGGFPDVHLAWHRVGPDSVLVEESSP